MSWKSSAWSGRLLKQVGKKKHVHACWGPAWFYWLVRTHSCELKRCINHCTALIRTDKFSLYSRKEKRVLEYTFPWRLSGSLNVTSIQIQINIALLLMVSLKSKKIQIRFFSIFFLRDSWNWWCVSMPIWPPQIRCKAKLTRIRNASSSDPLFSEGI